MLGFNVSDISCRPRKPGLAVLAKTFAAVAVVSFTVIIIPYSVSFAAAVIPRLSAALRAWLAPPILFAAVHLIILIIWKLSETKKQQEPLTDKLGDLVPSPESQTDVSASVLVSDAEVRIPEFNESMYVLKTTDAKDPDGDEIEKSAMLRVDSMEATMEEENVTTHEDYLMIIDEEDDDDSMEARWKAILQGGAAPVERFMLPEGAATGGGMQREVSEDCNQKFEAFIKKNYEQIRVAGKLGHG